MLKPRQNVIVSTVEPSGADRQKVWLQDKENMFDKNNANIIVAFVDGAGNVNFTDVTTRKSLYIMCKPQTSYTISKIASSCFRIGSCNNIPTVNNRKLINYNTLDGGANITNVSFNTGENANYLVITYYDSETDTLTEQEIIDTIKISDDSKEEKIHILNDNNIYEEFMKKDDTGWINLPLKAEITVGSIAKKAQYRKIGKTVYIRGDIAGVTEANTIIATLPAGFRPLSNVYAINALSGVRYSRIYVLSNGNLALEWVSDNNYNSSWYAIDCLFTVD